MKENELSEFIPYAAHLDKRTIKTISGDYLQIIKLQGRAHESADPEDVLSWKNQLNVMMRNIASPNIAIWSNTIRRQTTRYPDGTFTDGFADSLNKKYREYINQSKMLVNELYLTVVYRPLFKKSSLPFFTKLENPAVLKRQAAEAIEKLSGVVDIVTSNLIQYEPEILEIYENQGLLFSKPLEFLSYLANGEWIKRPLPRASISKALMYNRVFFGADAFEIRGVTSERQGVILSIAEYPETSEAGLLNALLSAPFECCISQSFTFLSKPAATSLLSRHQRIMENAEDFALSQIDEITTALDDLTAGRIVYGTHHLSLSIFGANIADLKRNLSAAHRGLTDCNIIVAREDWALAAAYWSQLPANFQYRARPAPISSMNFAGFSSFHNYPTGRHEGNQWGPSVTLFKTSSGAPYYFNFHEPRNRTKSVIKEEQKALGNTVIIGPSGSGKTVLQGFLMAQSKKFQPTQIIFDKDRGLEIYVRAESGIYMALQNGVPTGCNPFQLPNTESTYLFLESLLKKCAGGDFSTADEQEISLAVRGVMALPKEMRRISACLEFLDPVPPEGVHQRLSKWCGDNSLSWVFDHAEDKISFENNTMFGFDVTDFLDNPEVRTPIIMYLFHRIEQRLNGERVIIFMDEFWKLLHDDYFEDFAENKLKVIRKQNGLLVLGTQSPKDVLKSKIAHSIIEQCATSIYLPNPKGTKADYIDGFSLTEREFELIKEEILPGSRSFLIKQGHNSVVAQLDLKGFQEELAVISGSTDNVALVEQIIEETGDNPAIWLPKFHEQRGWA